MTWTDPRVALVRKLWADGLSASQIANNLGGTTRNAVIGKLHRLGLSKKKLPGYGRGKRRGVTSHKLRAITRNAQNLENAVMGGLIERRIGVKAFLSQAESRAPAETIAEANRSAKRITIADLELCHCKWPLWETDDDPRAYCGQDRAAGLPYCAAHARIAYRLPQTASSETKLFAGRRNLAAAVVKRLGPEPVEV